MARAFTPLLCKAQTLAWLNFVVCNIIINWVNSHSTGAKVRRINGMGKKKKKKSLTPNPSPQEEKPLPRPLSEWRGE